MDTKKIIRKEGNRIGLVVLANQLLFQVGTILMLFVVAMVLNILGVSKNASEGIGLYLASDIMQIIAGALYLGLYLFSKKSLEPIVKNKVTSVTIANAILIVLAANMLVSTIEIFFRRGLGIQLMPTDANLQVTPDNFLAMLFLGAVFPAIIEEIIYRGVVYRVLRANGIGYGMIVSSVIFGLIHMNFVQTPFAIVLGLVNCYLYGKTGRLRYSMLVHFVNNALTIIMLRFALSDTTNDVVQLVLAVVLVFVLFVICKRNTEKFRNVVKDVWSDNNKTFYFFGSIVGIILLLVCISASFIAIS